MHDQVELARLGLATVGLTTTSFYEFAGELLEQRNAARLPLVVVGHPVGGISEQAASGLITEEVLEAIVRALTVDEEQAA